MVFREETEKIWKKKKIIKSKFKIFVEQRVIPSDSIINSIKENYMNSSEMDNLSVFKNVFQAINDFFDPKYIDTTPIPKQENAPDELVQKFRKNNSGRKI